MQKGFGFVFNRFDGSDNFATKYLVNDACVLFDKILVHGSIHGFRGQVSVSILMMVLHTGVCFLIRQPRTLPSCSEM